MCKHRLHKFDVPSSLVAECRQVVSPCHAAKSLRFAAHGRGPPAHMGAWAAPRLFAIAGISPP